MISGRQGQSAADGAFEIDSVPAMSARFSAAPSPSTGSCTWCSVRHCCGLR